MGRAEFADRIDRLLDDKDLDELARAVNLKDTSDFSHYRVGRRAPDLDRLPALCEALHVSTDYVLGLTDDPSPARDRIATLTVSLALAEPSPDTDQFAALAVAEGDATKHRIVNSEAWLVSQLPILMVPIPLLLSPVSAGSPALGSDEVQSVVFLPLSHVHQMGIEGPMPPGRLVLVNVPKGDQGESMIDTIWPGATLMVDRGTDRLGAPAFLNGGIYLVRHEGGITAKRVWLTGKQLNIHADNRKERPFVIPLERGDLQEIRRYLAGTVVRITNPSHT